ncbi:hypothetical protein XENTR_v10020396 [Xenopus tropicalis]|nr:hypothetical protein XENTR_v10020396 [Xenopus tropicalis]
MGLCPSRKYDFMKGYSQASRWIYREEGIFEITDFEDPRVSPYLDCIRQYITAEIRRALYDYWMARDCLTITKWWWLTWKAEFRKNRNDAKVYLEYLYK